MATSSVDDLEDENDEEETWPDIVITGYLENIAAFSTMEANDDYNAGNFPKALMLLSEALSLYINFGLQNDTLLMRIVCLRARCFAAMRCYVEAVEETKTISSSIFASMGCPMKYWKLRIFIEESAGNIPSRMTTAFLLAIQARFFYPNSAALADAYERCKRKLRKGVRENKSVVDICLGMMLMAAQRLQNEFHLPQIAALVYTEILSLFYSTPLDVYYFRAVCYLQLGRFDDAEDDCQEVLCRYSENVDARDLLVKIKEIKRNNREKQKHNNFASSFAGQAIEGTSYDSQQLPMEKFEKKSPKKKVAQMPARPVKTLERKTKKERKTERRIQMQKEEEIRRICQGKEEKEKDQETQKQAKKEDQVSDPQPIKITYDVMAALDAGKKKKKSKVERTQSSNDLAIGISSGSSSVSSCTALQDTKSRGITQTKVSTPPTTKYSGKPPSKRNVSSPCLTSALGLEASTKQWNPKANVKISDENWPCLPPPVNDVNTKPKKSPPVQDLRKDGIKSSDRSSSLSSLSNTSKTSKYESVCSCENRMPTVSNKFETLTKCKPRLLAKADSLSAIPQRSQKVQPSSNEWKTVTPHARQSDHSTSTFVKVDLQASRENSLPPEIEIGCQHFLTRKSNKDNNGTACLKCVKTCNVCYVFWSKEFNVWTKVREYPPSLSMKQFLKQCPGYTQGQKCHFQERCTFPHGPEKEMWELERKGKLPTPSKFFERLKKGKLVESTDGSNGNTAKISEPIQPNATEPSSQILKKSKHPATTQAIGNTEELGTLQVHQVAAIPQSNSLIRRTQVRPQGPEHLTTNEPPLNHLAVQDRPSQQMALSETDKHNLAQSNDSERPEVERFTIMPTSSIETPKASLTKPNTQKEVPEHSQSSYQLFPVQKGEQVLNQSNSSVPSIRLVGQEQQAQPSAPMPDIFTSRSVSNGSPALTSNIWSSYDLSRPNIPLLQDSSYFPLGNASGYQQHPQAGNGPIPETVRRLPLQHFHQAAGAVQIPSEVKIVCNHFMNNCKKIPDFLCKGCENRHYGYYAFLDYRKGLWYKVRPYPRNLHPKLALKECKDFAWGRACARNPCTFPHGPELLMWTYEREGVLPPPNHVDQHSEQRYQNPTLHNFSGTGNLRPPPNGVYGGRYRLCNRPSVCRFGNTCSFAHGQEELNYWKFCYEQSQTDQAEPIEAPIKSESELLENLEGVALATTPENPNVRLKGDKERYDYTWTFKLDYKSSQAGHLCRVDLKDRRNISFCISKIKITDENGQEGTEEVLSKDKMFHEFPKRRSTSDHSTTVEVWVSFTTTVFGSFSQCILFDFGKGPCLVKNFNVDIVSDEELYTLKQARQEVPKNSTWNPEDSVIVRTVTDRRVDAVEELQIKYPCPADPQSLVSTQILSGKLNERSYHQTMHQLLFVEEVFMKQQIARFSMERVTLLGRDSLFSDDMGFQRAGEGLFGSFPLQTPVTIDDSAGRLCNRNVEAVYLRLSSDPCKVFEVPIHKLESEGVTIKLSENVCKELKIHDQSEVDVDAMFKLTRDSLCRMHQAVDCIAPVHLRLLFPKPQPLRIKEVRICWGWILDKRLNDSQKDVIRAIAKREPPSPPVVVFGPFGTGKSFTLNQGVRQLLTSGKNRILLCTKTNSAADIHVELLHQYLTEENGIGSAKPFRIYGSDRKPSTCSRTGLLYSNLNSGKDGFLMPTREAVIRYRVVITTLATSQLLMKIKLNHGFFSHILVDEAAQAWEPEALIPLGLAGPNTQVVFTGDHMQMSPEVYSKSLFNEVLRNAQSSGGSQEWGLQKSLPERLFDQYNMLTNEHFLKSHVMFLTENYRSNEVILQFSSDCFYGKKLVAGGAGDNLPHPDLGPLMFYSARGKEEIQHDNSFLNASEVDEVVKRVEELAEKWPNLQWGEKQLSEIAVLSAYHYQVRAIRDRLKRKGLRRVTVDTIHNVQGREFRAVFVSTVRTSHTVKPLIDQHTTECSKDELYFEFLSDPKLLNTAITRAKSLVAVVGDPVSLCTVGDCRRLWKDFIKRCNELRAFYGYTMEQLNEEMKAVINVIEMNPAAKPFVSDYQVEQTQENNEPDSDVENEDDALFKEQEASDTASVMSSGNEEELEQEGECPSRLLDETLADESVPPAVMDGIIRALRDKCEETRNKKAHLPSLQDSEFPPLGSKPVLKKNAGIWNTASPMTTHRLPNDTSDYEIKRVNGKEVIRLVDTGIRFKQSERQQRLTVVNLPRSISLDPEILNRRVGENPERFIVCELRISSDRFRTSYAVVADTKTPDIVIKGHVRQAFDRDTVVVDLKCDEDAKKNEEKTEDKYEKNEEARYSGVILGVKDHIINPKGRQYVCTADYGNPAVMKPINKFVSNIINLTYEGCKDVPIYRFITQENEPTCRVDWLKREKLLSNQNLFVVQFLQWRPDCTLPLGIVTKVLPRGESKAKCMEILKADHCLRASFESETVEEVKRIVGYVWEVPEEEKETRPRVSSAFTIDPETSKDLDDALSVEELSDGSAKVGIHIADVSYFVKPESALDKEARSRGTTYYPNTGDPNTPMLPEEISEGCCSLLPGCDRLAVSVYLTLDNSGELIGEPKVVRTVLRSRCKLSYSQAQKIIDGDSSELKREIQFLHKLAQARRHKRLGDASFDHLTGKEEREDIDAHELVEEMMILANHVVAKILFAKQPALTPLKAQLSPKEHRLMEWVREFGDIALLSLSLRKYVENHAGMGEISQPGRDIMINKRLWSKILEAVEEEDFRKLTHLICSDANHPQLAVAHQGLNRIQTKSIYTTSYGKDKEHTRHHSLGLDVYTHFTSPIRRYIDIVVHRMLLRDEGKERVYCEDDIYRICRRSTFLFDDSKNFGKACRRMKLAVQLQDKNHETDTVIESIADAFMSLLVLGSEDDHLMPKQREIKFNHLAPMTFDVNKETKEILLAWRWRMYEAPTYNSSEENPKDLKKIVFKQFPEGPSIKVNRLQWPKIIEAVKTKDGKKLKEIVRDIEDPIISQLPRAPVCKPGAAVKSKPDAPIYAHPNVGQTLTLPPIPPGAEGHFYDKIMMLKQFDTVKVQLSGHLTKGVLCPGIQLFKVSPRVSICLEHRVHTKKCFASTARFTASREHYDTIDNYIGSWKRVLLMEAAVAAVEEDQGFTIRNLPVQWQCKDGHFTGKFRLLEDYCRGRQISFVQGDLVCARIPHGHSDDAADVAVAHCIVSDTFPKEVDGKVWQSVVVRVHQKSSRFPAGAYNEKPIKCEMIFIPLLLPHRRMFKALVLALPDSTPLAHAICKGEAPPPDHFERPDKPLSISEDVNTTAFKRLNKYQEDAIKKALTQPFTLIQGPPGTGKTVTGVHIAYWFACQNRKTPPPAQPDPKDVDDENKPPSAPPQVLYCGPSNKSVDVVTEYLLRIPGMQKKILRVQGSMIQEREFPIPNKIKPPKQSRSEDELRIPSKEVREVSLHYIIRSADCPYAESLKLLEQTFKDAKERNDPVSVEDVTSYLQIIREAEKWCIQKTGREIILCTCSASGADRIVDLCDNIQQVIVDECGMCFEPETLVPITCARAKQVVLIGDHKQLQPIIKDNDAKRLGLEISMFERYAKKAIMLKEQYRMHAEICHFPSEQFYDKLLLTSATVALRTPSPVDFWPAQVLYRKDVPRVFCHVEGCEKSSVIKTQYSNHGSKSNEKEANKAVHVAKVLVNKYAVNHGDVVILTPYRQQQVLIKEGLHAPYDDIQVSTIIKSQGSEWDYVILSLVRSLPKDEIEAEPSSKWLVDNLGFLRDEHQINVALTRARRGLCIIGNKNLVELDPTWSALLSHYEQGETIVDEAWPWN
ncbi:helicase with zinc finger domain 2-like isoform X4 [Nematostella vectensis]|uniref:helicase with zinc finger domain 2-like isoform X4 n=1 Tax=Nematostella vectensis TaxID=45351 RepID=UPI0020778EBF|nr:helicase with zinc finger domain 2-like isoform X4 [Nematostella vectensis]